MAHVITLTGPSGCGKSKAITYFLRCKNNQFRPIVIPKYSTRPPRDDDGDEINAGLVALPDHCDLVYEQYNLRYGLSMESVYKELSAGNSPLIILNDVRAVEDMRSALGGLVKSIFLYRNDPDVNFLRSLSKKRGVIDQPQIVRRQQKAQAIYRIYIENIHLFDHVILNRYGLAELKKQVKMIVRGLGQLHNWPLV